MISWINVGPDNDPHTARWRVVLAESGCRYFAELTSPDPLAVGFGVTRLGTSSVTLRATDFKLDRKVQAYLLQQRPLEHVYVNRLTRRLADPGCCPDAARDRGGLTAFVHCIRSIVKRSPS